MTKQRYDMYEI